MTGQEQDIEARRAALAAAEQRAAVAEQALARASNEARVLRQRLEGFVVNIPGILWESYFQQSPADSIVDYVSELIEPLSGYTADKWKQPNFWIELVHPEDRPGAIEASTLVLFATDLRSITTCSTLKAGIAYALARRRR